MFVLSINYMAWSKQTYVFKYSASFWLCKHKQISCGRRRIIRKHQIFKWN